MSTVDQKWAWDIIDEARSSRDALSHADLTKWEWSFIDSVHEKRQYPLSDKQIKVIERIDDTVMKAKG